MPDSPDLGSDSDFEQLAERLAIGHPCDVYAAAIDRGVVNPVVIVIDNDAEGRHFAAVNFGRVAAGAPGLTFAASLEDAQRSLSGYTTVNASQLPAASRIGDAPAIPVVLFSGASITIEACPFRTAPATT